MARSLEGLDGCIRFSHEALGRELDHSVKFFFAIEVKAGIVTRNPWRNLQSTSLDFSD
jgi:hypothetical protein